MKGSCIQKNLYILFVDICRLSYARGIQINEDAAAVFESIINTVQYIVITIK